MTLVRALREVIPRIMLNGNLMFMTTYSIFRTTRLSSSSKVVWRDIDPIMRVSMMLSLVRVQSSCLTLFHLFSFA